MITSVVLISLGMISMLIFLYGKMHGYSLKTVIVKSIASSLFVALAIYLYVYNGFPNIGLYFVLGAIFGLFGDIILALKRIITSKQGLFKILGFLSFAIGHILFVTGLYVNYYVQGHVLAIIIPVIISLLMGASALLIEKLFKVDFGSYKPAAILYLTLLSSLSISALALNIITEFKSTFLILVLVGGILFATSDLTLCRTYFGKSNSKAELIIYTMTYYLAQFLLAFSLFYL